ncbi:Maf family protein [Oceanobacillus damuensis]|uniref:Maf family protein n=1 Tax=Oceanobacillus damuensis TaxID=937928 RepID=UPI00083343BF|nr:Maf family protein [Oceanobacillus damuensis]
MTKTLILASSSPRRQEILNQIQLPFSIRKPSTDESQVTTNDPAEKVSQLALLKGRNVSIDNKDEIILSADTIVSHNQKIYEKPKDKEEAYQMISALSGSIHEVFTGVMIRSINDRKVFVERTKVEFWPLSEEEIEWYLSTDDPYDKAGAYGIQSVGAMFVKQIIGDYYNVVGLPISRVVRELRGFSVYPEDGSNTHLV